MARILLVEDEETQRKALETMLKSGDHKVLLASHGAQALVLAQDKKPDVIVSDLAMPKMDGKALCEKIRATPGIEGTYVIVITALEGDVPRLESMLVGADDFVRKPVVREDLIHRVDMGIRTRGLRREIEEAQAQAAQYQQTQDLLVVAVDAGLRGIEEAGARLKAGDASGAVASLKAAHEEVRASLGKVPAPEAGG
jgi:DNA-binding response OmpR family regulator